MIARSRKIALCGLILLVLGLGSWDGIEATEATGAVVGGLWDDINRALR